MTLEDRFIAAMDNLSQELKGKPPERLNKTTLQQLTTLGNILKLNIEDEDEQQKIAQSVPSRAPPRVPTNTENLLPPPPRVKACQIT